MAGDNSMAMGDKNEDKMQQASTQCNMHSETEMKQQNKMYMICC